MSTGASAAARQIEYWYKHYLDGLVQEARTTVAGSPGRLSPINGAVMAQAHEQAWRHAVVRAQRSCNPSEWAQLSVADEQASYQDLLRWSAAKYRVDEEDVKNAQTSQGYRHHPR